MRKWVQDDPGLRSRRTGRPTPGIRSAPTWAPAPRAMIYDADMPRLLHERRRQQGWPAHLAYAAFKANPDATATPTSNVWIWSLAMSNFSKEQGRDLVLHAVGLQSPTTAIFGATQDGLRQSGPRQSVWKDQEFRDQASRRAIPVTSSMYRGLGAPTRSIYFTPQPLFFDADHRVGGRRCRKWSPTRCRWTRVSTSWPRASTASSSRSRTLRRALRSADSGIGRSLLRFERALSEIASITG